MKLIQTQVVDKVQQARRKEEARLLAAAEVSKQDVERFLMELEEQHSWVAYELNARNLSRLKQSAKLSRFKAHLARELREGIDKEEKESGLMSYKGLITSFTRWQNSPAKHLDLEGHGNAILSVKISKCRQYLLSCSTDMTAKVWELSSGINLRVYPRHERIVLDCDIHPSFVMDSPLPLLITCSGKFVYLWCTSHDFAIKKIAAHEEIVYKCSFSPSGAQIITCSEDHSLRLWAFPECFHLFTFEGHQAPVTTARFSPSGRFILSGSSYAERKLLLWDAAMPKIHNPLQFCCVIFWTTDGLIKRICLQRKVADWTFWLTKAEALRVKGLDMEALPGELDVVEMDTESERSDNSNDSDDEDDDESENIDPFEDAFFAQDIRTCQGARLVVLSFDGEEEGVKAATEYIPGSYLVIRLQSGYEPIIEASITVAIKSLKYDSFACASGSRAGVFLPLSLVSCMEGADEETRDEVTGLFSRGNAPAGYKTDSSGQAFTFRSMDFKESYGSLDEESRSNTIEILWACPNLFDLGPLVITVNLKLRGERRWQPLRYSLRESSTRYVYSVSVV